MKKEKQFYREDVDVCPRCGNGDCEYGVFDIVDVFYPVTCNNCGLEFREYYNLEYSHSVGEANV
jgi:transcription elongation factor Elf1